MSAEPITPLGAKRLAIVSGVAVAAGALLFAAFVLPAEFHKDPLGVGRLTGLNKLAGPKDVAVAPAAGGGPATQFYTRAYRSDEIDIPLATIDAGMGGEELEYKVRMKKGDSIVYSWTVDGVTNPEEFYFDFHGETPPNPEVQVVEFRQATGLSSNGVMIAPMDGIYGWYLQNQSASPAVVRLKLSGFYELVPPGETGNEAGISPKSAAK